MKRGSGSNSEKITFSGNVNKVPGEEWGYAACTASPNSTKLTALRSATGIYFKCNGDGGTYRVEVVTSNVQNYNYYQYEFTAPAAETTITIPYTYLTQKDWDSNTDPKPFTKSLITEINFHARAELKTGSYSFTIWDLECTR